MQLYLRFTDRKTGNGESQIIYLNTPAKFYTVLVKDIFKDLTYEQKSKVVFDTLVK